MLAERITYKTSPNFPRPRKLSVTFVLPHLCPMTFPQHFAEFPFLSEGCTWYLYKPRCSCIEVHHLPPSQRPKLVDICLQVLLLPIVLDQASQHKYIANVAILIHSIEGPQNLDPLLIRLRFTCHDKQRPRTCADG